MTPDALGTFLLEDSKMKRIELEAGTVFDRWTVTNDTAFKKYGRWHYVCKCINEHTKEIAASTLRNRKAGKCTECYKKEMNEHKHTSQNKWKHRRLRRSWTDMHSRCYNANDTAYERYGGRGIKVCKEWDSFECFKAWALSHNYTDKLTIERIDNNEGYYPTNCRWVTYKEQNRNRRSNTYYEAFGESKIISDWAEDIRCSVPITTLQDRLTRDNWEIEHAITFPKNPGLSYSQMKESYL